MSGLEVESPRSSPGSVTEVLSHLGRVTFSLGLSFTSYKRKVPIQRIPPQVLS